MTDPNTKPDTDPSITLNKTPITTPDTGTSTETPAQSETAPTTPAATPPRRRRRPLFPTIFWGVLMLALAAFIGARELVPAGLDLVTWMLTAVVAIGFLLVVAGIAAASRRAG